MPFCEITKFLRLAKICCEGEREKEARERGRRKQGREGERSEGEGKKDKYLFSIRYPFVEKERSINWQC